MVTPEYRDEVLMCLSRAFVTEPVCSAIAEIKPEMKTELHDWVEFVDYWMDHCSSNGMSVMAIDEEKHRVAGAFIVRDLLMIPEGFDQKYSSDAKTLTPWMQFLWHMDKKATEKMPELGEKGAAVDFWFLGVHPDYRGNKIANFMTKGVIPLVTMLASSTERLKQRAISRRSLPSGTISRRSTWRKPKTGSGKVSLSTRMPRRLMEPGLSGLKNCKSD